MRGHAALYARGGRFADRADLFLREGEEDFGAAGDAEELGGGVAVGGDLEVARRAQSGEAQFLRGQTRAVPKQDSCASASENWQAGGIVRS